MDAVRLAPYMTAKARPMPQHRALILTARRESRFEAHRLLETKGRIQGALHAALAAVSKRNV